MPIPAPGSKLSNPIPLPTPKILLPYQELKSIYFYQ